MGFIWDLHGNVLWLFILNQTIGNDMRKWNLCRHCRFPSSGHLTAVPWNAGILHQTLQCYIYIYIYIYMYSYIIYIYQIYMYNMYIYIYIYVYIYMYIYICIYIYVSV